MPARAMRLLVTGLALCTIQGGCGGEAISGSGAEASTPADAATDAAPPQSGADASVSKPDAGAPRAFDRGEQPSIGWRSDTGPTCSLPVGALAPGCPMLLAPSCEWPILAYSLSPGQCALPFTAPIPIPDSLAYVNVHFRKGQSDLGRLLRVKGSQDCDTTGNGWYFDDPLQPTTIHICPNACECAQTEEGSFGVFTGCWVNAAPGVMDSMPCARCAKSRKQSCSSASGGYGHPFVKCEFALEQGFDPNKINLKYVQHGSTAGEAEPWDGYLTFVPSLADCDNVEEGWTLDMSTQPPTIHVCPTACSCAKINSAELMVEAGCERNELG